MPAKHPARQDRLREANEQLLLAAIREQEVADDLRMTAAFREKLLGIVGHDLRGPLAAIKLTLAGLACDDVLEEKTAAIMRSVHDTVVRMDKMILQLLDFTRAHQVAGFSIEPRAANLRSICEAVIMELECGHARPGAFRRRYDECLDGMWDADRLTQVISNLGDNALKYGARHQAIVLSVHDCGENVVLEITNRGRPIPSEQIASLFGPFRRVIQPSSNSDGLGFGLYIANEIVRAHGGTIAVRSTRTEGTTFSVQLPRAQTLRSIG